jgi:hypothetical protein
MNLIVPQILTHEILFKCVSSLTTTILSSHNIYNYIISNSSNDYQKYQNEISSTDLANKLLLASSIIKDIIKKHHKITNSTGNNLPIEELVEIYKEQFTIESIREEEEYDLVTHINNNKIIPDVPEPVKIALSFTLDSIDKINTILEQIHNKIKTHSSSYTKYIVKLDIKKEVDSLIYFDKIFDKRLELLFEVVKIYKHEI